MTVFIIPHELLTKFENFIQNAYLCQIVVLQLKNPVADPRLWKTKTY